MAAALSHKPTHPTWAADANPPLGTCPPGAFASAASIAAASSIVTGLPSSFRNGGSSPARRQGRKTRSKGALCASHMSGGSRPHEPVRRRRRSRCGANRACWGRLPALQLGQMPRVLLHAAQSTWGMSKARGLGLGCPAKASSKVDA